MCKLKKLWLFLVLVLLSVPLFAWSPKIVGESSKDVTIGLQKLLIGDLESKVVDLKEEISLKESEISSLQESLKTQKDESTQLKADLETLLLQVSDLEKLLQEAESGLQEAENEQETLETQLDESQSELTESKVLVQTATKIVQVETPVSPFGGFFGAGVTYDMLGDMAAEIYGGMSYKNVGLYVGVQSDIALDMYLPSNFTYKAGLQFNF